MVLSAIYIRKRFVVLILEELSVVLERVIFTFVSNGKYHIGLLFNQPVKVFIR